MIGSRFVWHDLMTTDADRSMAFFVGLMGWRVRTLEVADLGPYTVFELQGRDVAGLVPLKPMAEVRSHWMPYIAVDDVDQASAAGVELGGRLCVEPMDLPDAGRFSVVADPASAVVSLIRRAEEPAAPPSPSPGTFCWDELLTTGPDAAAAFYRGVCDWGSKTRDMGEMGTYWLLLAGETEVAGMMQSPPEAQGPPFWNSYLMVGDVDESAVNVERLGGAVWVAPTDIPDVGRFAVAADPTGASFGLFRRHATD